MKIDSVARQAAFPVVLLVLLFLPLSGQEKTPRAAGWESVPSILKRIVPPQFPNRDFDVTAFGAVGDGVTDCTQAFADAIGKLFRNIPVGG